MEVYEIEFTVLQEEQSCNKSEVERMRGDLETREAELREARAEVTRLQERLEAGAVNNNHIEAGGIF